MKGRRSRVGMEWQRGFHRLKLSFFLVVGDLERFRMTENLNKTPLSVPIVEAYIELCIFRQFQPHRLEEDRKVGTPCSSIFRSLWYKFGKVAPE